VLSKSGALSGGGGLTGTLDDYMRFCEMLRLDGIAPAGQLLSPQRTAFMLRNHLPGDIARWGRPVFPNSRRAVSGSGLPPGNLGDFSWGGMASTVFWIDHHLDLSVIFLTQLAPSSSYPARPELKALVHGAFTQGPNLI
jgi:CubicO group peptidase (beta-lactamase class C family)